MERWLIFPDEVFRPGDVVELTQQQPHRRNVASGSQTYALYYGRGRVIHAWSSSRTHFRVRVDTLRSLKSVGLVASSATKQLDSYCDAILGLKPLTSKEIVPRARTALHCPADNALSSLSFVLWARFGDAVLGLAHSLSMIVPCLFFFGGDYDDVYIYDGPRPDPLRTPIAVPVRLLSALVRPEQEVALPSNIPGAHLLEPITSIKSLLESKLEGLMAAMVACGLSRARLKDACHSPNDTPFSFKSVDHGVLITVNRERNMFTLMFKSDENLGDRLVDDDLECGVCLQDFHEQKARVLKCSHVLCASCLQSLVRKTCPFCREPIIFVRELTSETITSMYQAVDEHPAEPTQAEQGEIPSAPASPNEQIDHEGDQDDTNKASPLSTRKTAELSSASP
ncbi:hypothetical protein Poli38472_002522 [Pythium oligandrum]|uniref:RING-type domain-containing protein n=1 Tax=Pythium oligandrum TaxID=41045 RepID=A0A8K1CIW9_PYTOL|nr:hypothetical protein Poli38472_002522 [Pythium oligandrum]|eukprot:TMW63581.1 hypothetical protein Poli38472_002522 [Pythium oligandrum]